MPHSITLNGWAVWVCSHAQISDTTPALKSQGKSKKGRVVPAKYVPNKKWNVVLSYNTLKIAQLLPEDKKYHQYHHGRNWMEKSSMKMLPDQNSERDKLHHWRLFRSARSACNGVSIWEWYKCLMHHQSDCTAGLLIVIGKAFKHLEHWGSHHLDSHVCHIMSAHDTKEEDEDSDMILMIRTKNQTKKKTKMKSPKMRTVLLRILTQVSLMVTAQTFCLLTRACIDSNS
jgi:hypothetical protein